MEKINTKKLWVKLVAFIVGMLSVSISNLFGGYYCSTAIITIVLATIYIYNVFENNEDINENLVSIGLISAIAAFQLIFFVVNDIFNTPVYVKNSFSFMSVIVIISQFISIAAIVYELSYVLKSFLRKEPHVELIDSNQNETDLEEDVDVNEENENNQEYEIEQDIKYISQNNIEEEVPFMEEE